MLLTDLTREQFDQLESQLTGYDAGGNRFIYDRETGEILYEEFKTAPQYDPPDEVLYLKDVKSVDGMERFMKVMIDKRKIRGSNTNDLRHFFDLCLGYKVLKEEPFGHLGSMSVPQYKLLDKIGELISYRNVVMVTRESLCKHIGCKDKNLMTKLRLITEPRYIKVVSGTRRGEIKILINPKFFYICENSIYDISRNRATREWYAHIIEEQSPLVP